MRMCKHPQAGGKGRGMENRNRSAPVGGRACHTRPPLHSAKSERQTKSRWVGECRHLVVMGIVQEGSISWMLKLQDNTDHERRVMAGTLPPGQHPAMEGSIERSMEGSIERSM